MLVLFGVLLTIAVYCMSKRLYQKSANLIFSPLLVCPLIVIAVLTVFQISYETYNSGGQLLSMMLQPAMVALAVPVYKYRSILKTYIVEILISVTVGSIVAIITSMGAAKLLGMNSHMISSLVPRSITTPMAMNVSQLLGGDPAITAVLVIVSGLTGVLLTSVLLKWTPAGSPITKGMMFGASAHGTGTSRAYELGSLEGAIASLAMVFMGIITTVIAPALVPFGFHLLSRFSS
ncbi:CidB/LrgB family autolysis modulator [Anaerosporomusa subterranea]|uniref:CidB/LrgB family autolysis modulator n=1 Tax=Anaerosporomusa subterranea TaxID=1794912 RepID=A0A154BQ43_ANASB|nr:LrgB family protein [Anaerosporomusa subterranea]KYZ76077.1 CidB/LrgB family autolysis modulator [Anaerosporomusa subterranea]